jgi:hypothetical protein
MRIEASVTMNVPDGAPYEQMRQKAQSELRTLLEETYKAQKKGKQSV